MPLTPEQKSRLRGLAAAAHVPWPTVIKVAEREGFDSVLGRLWGMLEWDSELHQLVPRGEAFKPEKKKRKK